MSSPALVDQSRSTATTIRPSDPRRTNFTIDFDFQDYEDKLPRQEDVAYADPSNWVPAVDYERLSSVATCQAALVVSYVNRKADRSRFLDVLAGTFQGESFGSQISAAVYSAGTAFGGTWSLSREVSESLSALTAACDSVSTGLNSWSELNNNAVKQIAAAMTSRNSTTTVTWGDELFSRTDDLTVLAPEVGKVLTDFLERIADFARLEPDWDSYGAKSPTTEALNAAGQYLQALVAQYSSTVGIRVLPFWVYPLPSGGIKLEWREPESELEVEIDPEGNLRYLLQTSHGLEADFKEQEEASLTEVTEVLGRVLAA